MKSADCFKGRFGMKKALLFLLSLLMVFSFVSCKSDTPQDHNPAYSTINITVDIKTDSAIEKIQQYGQFFAVILTDNGGTYDFVKAYYTKSINQTGR